MAKAVSAGVILVQGSGAKQMVTLVKPSSTNPNSMKAKIKESPGETVKPSPVKSDPYAVLKAALLTLSPSKQAVDISDLGTALKKRKFLFDGKLKSYLRGAEESGAVKLSVKGKVDYVQLV